MGGSFEYGDNKDLTYDNLYYKYNKFKDEYEFGVKVDEFDYFERDNNKIIYSKEEIENILKECIENMVIEIENVIDEKFEQHNFMATYNRYVHDWNEVLCSIEVNGKLVEVKLTNDYVSDEANSISSVYITLYNDGKGIFTECIERINQEYEFIGSVYSYVPINERELCFKELDENKFIESIVSEINKII
ncbi:hypothetical protein CLPUN_15150 [Clostridium puniceum]|uniref:Uncharacterized protein n=1 Tax=Clostridium puniceum TaxID=29367 RepID=A0A1S8TP65_9CLOT|nr:hypothetical protein [Clostridium puniceum]OOM79567.1 hypothetical protein CLPUN_15150 [Clostridium puniceum]